MPAASSPPLTKPHRPATELRRGSSQNRPSDPSRVQKKRPPPHGHPLPALTDRGAASPSQRATSSAPRGPLGHTTAPVDRNQPRRPRVQRPGTSTRSHSAPAPEPVPRGSLRNPAFWTPLISETANPLRVSREAGGVPPCPPQGAQTAPVPLTRAHVLRLPARSEHTSSTFPHRTAATSSAATSTPQRTVALARSSHRPRSSSPAARHAPSSARAQRCTRALQAHDAEPTLRALTAHPYRTGAPPREPEPLRTCSFLVDV